MKRKLILGAAALTFVLWWMFNAPITKPIPPDPGIVKLQAEIQSLRVDIEDIKAVQGSEIYNQIRKERERRATP